MHYSQGRFGFSVQKKIYIECGGKLDGKYPGDSTRRRFGDKVGWRIKGEWVMYSSLTFSTSAPSGHLPYGGGFRFVGGMFVVFLNCVNSLFSHRDL
ncbi:MAG: GUN4 domain-containing protein [Leptolyngbyaceae cyanobacterium]